MKRNSKNLRLYKKLCKTIWDEREHVCSKCGKYLPVAKYSTFHHTNGRIKDGLNKESIILTCFKCHSAEHGIIAKNSGWLDY